MATVTRPSDPRQAVARRSARPQALPNLPLILRILWINWAVVTIINLAVWVAVPGADYFWPAWMAVPGMLLFGASAVAGVVRGRPSSPVHGS